MFSPRFFVMRHGASESNVAGTVQGVMDVPLAPLGIAQGKLAGEQLRGWEITHIVTSPLIRASRTAALVGEALGLQVTEEPGLVARNLGEWAGKPRAEIKAMWADRAHPFRADPNFAPPGGESLRNMDKRVFEAVDRYLSNNCGRPLFVLHMVGTGALVSRLTGARPAFRNTEVWGLDPDSSEARPVFSPEQPLLPGNE